MTAAFPENFDLLHQGEERIREHTVSVIKADDEMLSHMGMIEGAMDVLDV